MRFIAEPTRKPRRISPAAASFLSNYEPISIDQAVSMVEHVVEFDRYTEPMKRLLEDFARSGDGGPAYVVSSAHPRMVDGKPSKNPRYLQKRPDLVAPREGYLMEIAARLERGGSRRTPGSFPGERGAFRTAGTIRRISRSASRLWPCTVRSITRSCRSCSWSSSPA